MSEATATSVAPTPGERMQADLEELNKRHAIKMIKRYAAVTLGVTAAAAIAYVAAKKADVPVEEIANQQ